MINLFRKVQNNFLYSNMTPSRRSNSQRGSATLSNSDKLSTSSKATTQDNDNAASKVDSIPGTLISEPTLTPASAPTPVDFQLFI